MNGILIAIDKIEKKYENVKKKIVLLSPKHPENCKKNDEDGDQIKETYLIMKSCYWKIQENQHRDEVK